MTPASFGLGRPPVSLGTPKRGGEAFENRGTLLITPAKHHRTIIESLLNNH